APKSMALRIGALFIVGRPLPCCHAALSPDGPAVGSPRSFIILSSVSLILGGLTLAAFEIFGRFLGGYRGSFFVEFSGLEKTSCCHYSWQNRHMKPPYRIELWSGGNSQLLNVTMSLSAAERVCQEPSRTYERAKWFAFVRLFMRRSASG